MATVSRTVNPIHFEDLEPHRFEDLVRQLAYEFKPWRKLEATGRSGRDQGFDARGWEIVGDPADHGEEAGEDVQGVTESLPTTDRLWLIQCKREREIGPTKLEGYLDAIPEAERTGLYGVIIAAACDFSKESRDKLIAKSGAFGFLECHLWGKAELEDMLFQPKNDHLLFAYFGFSLTIRRRSLRAEVRARLAMKRKAYRHLEQHSHQLVLLRDPRTDKYPFDHQVPHFSERPPWKVYIFDEFTRDGPRFKVRRSPAYIADDRKSWDVAPFYNQEIMPGTDPWGPRHKEMAAIQKIMEPWNKLPDKNKAWFESWGIVAYEEIIDIDEHGDELVEGPHVYVPFEHDGRAFKFSSGKVHNVTKVDGEYVELEPKSPDDGRVKFFPEESRAFPGVPKPSSQRRRQKRSRSRSQGPGE